MKNENGLKNILSEALQDDILDLEHKRLRYVKIGSRNKNYFLLAFLLLIPIESVGLLDWIENSTVHYFILAGLSISILLTYIRLKPLSMIAQYRISDFNNDAKKLFSKGFSILNKEWTYKPIYKTQQKHFINSGLFGSDFKVEKESDGLIIWNRSQKICLSHTVVYGNLKKVFEGLFVIIDCENSKPINLDHLNSILSEQTIINKPFKITLSDKYTYLSIPINRNIMSIELEEKESLSFEPILNSFNSINSIIEDLKKISLINSEANIVELSY